MRSQAGQEKVGLHPFFLLGLRRSAEKPAILGRVAFIATLVAFLPLVLSLVSTWIAPGSKWSLWVGDVQPINIYFTVAGFVYLACFLIPFLVAGASDLFFTDQWRANSILLATPMTSRSLFWAKFILLFTVGLPALAALVPPMTVIFLVWMPNAHAFLGLFCIGLLVYFASAFALSAFSRRWEAGLFWLFLYPIGSVANGFVAVAVAILNAWLGFAQRVYPGNLIVRMLPGSVPYPEIPTWVMAGAVFVLTMAWLVRKGMEDIDRMRSGQIAWNRMVLDIADERRQRVAESWYGREYVRPDKARPPGEYFVPPSRTLYRPTFTDYLFYFLVGVWFWGRGTALSILNTFPKAIKDNPIYQRHTARFRGFLAGDFEPSGGFKSNVVAVAVLFATFAVFPFGPFVIAGLIYLITSGHALQLYTTCLVLIFAVSLLSPVDAYVRLVRMHRERTAWESVIITPISGPTLVTGTFGVLLAHRLVPFIPVSAYALLVGLLFLQPPQTVGATIVLAHSVHFAGLAVAAGISWHIANRAVSTTLLFVWGLGIVGAIWAVFRYVGLLVVPPSHGLTALLVPFPIAAMVVALGILLQYSLGRLFDVAGRHPFPRRTEEGY